MCCSFHLKKNILKSHLIDFLCVVFLKKKIAKQKGKNKKEG